MVILAGVFAALVHFNTPAEVLDIFAPLRR
jgi:hypothetical protein